MADLKHCRAPGCRDLARQRGVCRRLSRAAKRGVSTFFNGRVPVKILDNDDIQVSTHGMPFWRKYATTKRGGREQDPVHLADIPVCSSVYGLCE